MDKFLDIKNALTSTAERLGIEKYEIYYQSSSDISTETLKDELSSFSCGTSAGICFRCIVDGKMGYASTELMDVDEMEQLVLRASQNARYIDSDEQADIFAGSDKYGTKTAEYLPLPDVALMKSKALEIQAKNYEQSEYVTDGTQSVVMAYETETRLINSEGLDLVNKASMAAAFSEIIINKNGEPSESFDAADFYDENKLQCISAQAHETALSKLGAGSVETGTYDIVISGKQMRSILAAFWSIFSAQSVRLGTSLLKNKIDTVIANECVTISDDPFDPNCHVQTTFDAEGMAVYKKNLVEHGVLKTFLYNMSEATRAGVTSTANAYKSGYADTIGIRPYRFAIDPGENSLEELFEIVKNGLYVTEIKGLHAGANETTGDFSIESAGFVIENGKKGRPVKSFTIAGNFYDLLKNITHIENKIEYGISGGLNVFASPSILVRNISVAGK